jgi:hypothetical protein
MFVVRTYPIYIWIIIEHNGPVLVMLIGPWIEHFWEQSVGWWEGSADIFKAIHDTRLEGTGCNKKW